ncbi:hypothetical protein BDW68DRAFT_171187 [Aspergillus falconensis]
MTAFVRTSLDSLIFRRAKVVLGQVIAWAVANLSSAVVAKVGAAVTSVSHEQSVNYRDQEKGPPALHDYNQLSAL